MFIVYLVHQVYCVHCGATADKGTSELFVLLQSRAPGVLLRLLLQLREFTPVWRTVKFIYLIKGLGAYELSKVVECSTANFMCTDVEMQTMLPNSNCKLPNIKFAEHHVTINVKKLL